MALSTACTAPDPAAITFVERPSSSGSRPRARADQARAGSADRGRGGGRRRGQRFGSTPFSYVDPGTSANNANLAHEGSVVGKDCTGTAGCSHRKRLSGRGFSPGRLLERAGARRSRKVRSRLLGRTVPRSERPIPTRTETSARPARHDDSGWKSGRSAKRGAVRRSTWPQRFSRVTPVATRPAIATADRPARSTRTESLPGGVTVRKRWTVARRIEDAGRQ